MTRGRANPKHLKFPQRLRRMRKAAGMHAAGLSIAAGLGSSVVGLLEAGRGVPRLPTVEKLARALHVNPGWLAYGMGDAAELAEPGTLCEGMGKRAREARALLGISIREVARRAGLTESVVRSTEKGRQPALSTVEQHAKALAVSPSWLAYGIGPAEHSLRRLSLGSGVPAGSAR